RNNSVLLDDWPKRFHFLGFGVSILIPDFKNVLANHPEALNYYGDSPKIAAYKTLIKAIFEWLNRDKPNFSDIPFSFLFDQDGGYLEAEKAYADLRNIPLYAE